MNWHSWTGASHSDPHHRSHLEYVGPEGGVGELHDVAGPDQVEPGLVLVHRVQDRLGGGEHEKPAMVETIIHIRVVKKSGKMFTCYIDLRIASETTKADKLGRKIGHNFP